MLSHFFFFVFMIFTLLVPSLSPKCTFLQLQKSFRFLDASAVLSPNWSSLKMPQSNNWPLYQFLYMSRPRLPSGLLDFVFYLIPTFLLRSDRPMKKPILEVGFQSSFIKIDGNWYYLETSKGEVCGLPVWTTLFTADVHQGSRGQRLPDS